MAGISFETKQEFPNSAVSPSTRNITEIIINNQNGNQSNIKANTQRY